MDSEDWMLRALPWRGCRWQGPMMFHWGWRAPFLASAPVSGLRRTLPRP